MDVGRPLMRDVEAELDRKIAWAQGWGMVGRYFGIGLSVVVTRQYLEAVTVVRPQIHEDVEWM